MFQLEVTIILIDKKQQRVSNIWYNVGPQWVEPDTGQGVSKFGCPAQSDVKFPPDDVYSWCVYSSGLATNQLAPTRLKELSDVKLEISNKNLKIHGRSKQNLSVCITIIHVSRNFTHETTTYVLHWICMPIPFVLVTCTYNLGPNHF